MIFPLGGPHGRRLEVLALVVDTLEQYYGVPQGSMWKWQMQLGIEDNEILPLLQVAQPGDRHWGEMTLERVRLNSGGVSRSMWKFLVCKGQLMTETVWLSAVQCEPGACLCHGFPWRLQSGWGAAERMVPGEAVQ